MDTRKLLRGNMTEEVTLRAVLPTKELSKKPAFDVDFIELDGGLGYSIDLPKTVDEMLNTMFDNEGIAITAPHIGMPYNIILLRMDGAIVGLVNPEVVEESTETKLMVEAPLDDKGFEVQIRRPENITVKYKDALGEEKTSKYDGFEARCVLHCMDYLHGVRLQDKASKHYWDKGVRLHTSAQKKKDVDEFAKTLAI